MYSFGLDSDLGRDNPPSVITPFRSKLLIRICTYVCVTRNVEGKRIERGKRMYRHITGRIRKEKWCHSDG